MYVWPTIRIFGNLNRSSAHQCIMRTSFAHPIFFRVIWSLPSTQCVCVCQNVWINGPKFCRVKYLIQIVTIKCLNNIAGIHGVLFLLCCWCLFIFTNISLYKLKPERAEKKTCLSGYCNTQCFNGIWLKICVRSLKVFG